MKALELVGQKFARFVVIAREPNNKNGQAMWLCRCECGKQRRHTSATLTTGHVQSCGCIRGWRNRLETKACTRCKVVQAQKRFGWLKKHHRGKPEIHRDSWCRDCRRAYKHHASYRAVVNKRLAVRQRLDPQYRARCRASAKRFANLYRTLEKARLIEKYGSLKLAYLDRRLGQKFGVTLRQYYAMCKAQQRKCAICRKAPRLRRLAIDHDHRNGRARELLCNNCNLGLGNFQDDLALLRRAMAYLRKHARLARRKAA
jgi:hypothetical protein